MARSWELCNPDGFDLLFGQQWVVSYLRCRLKSKWILPTHLCVLGFTGWIDCHLDRLFWSSWVEIVGGRECEE